MKKIQKKWDFLDWMCPLSCLDVLKSFQLYDELKEQLMQEDGNETLVQVLAEYAVLGYFSLRKDGKPVYDSPKALLQSMTIEELAGFYESYRASFLNPESGGIEDENI